MSDPFHVVIMTTPATGTPHLAELVASNPDLAVSVCMSPDAETAEDAKNAWRNCDRNIRGWWREFGAGVAADQVLFLEYDVRVTVDLTKAIRRMPAGFGMSGAAVKGQAMHGHAWPLFAEAVRLPREVRALACGIAPLAVVLVSRSALDALADERWDAAFAEDVFCELRMPTLVRASGFRIMEQALPNVLCGRFSGSMEQPGIYHAIKP